MAKIDYTDKENLQTNSNVAAERKVAASDMNAIKASINALYDVGGWGVYSDTGSSLAITSTDVLLTIDKNSVIEDYLPPEIRGTGTLFADNKITPIAAGDSYDVRLDLTILSKSNNPKRLDIKLDIGDQATPSTVIVNRSISVERNPPYSTSVGFPIYALSTFLSNGGQFFASTDAGNLTISARTIFIKRDFAEK